jgi:hypothetical protein
MESGLKDEASTLFLVFLVAVLAVLPHLVPSTLARTTTFEVGFEDSSGFQLGSESVWNNSAAPYQLYYESPEPPYPPSPNTFEPSSEIVHSGAHSAKLSLLNPITDRARRIHIEHNWDPLSSKDLWVECWYYLPVGFTPDDWTDFHRCLEERWGSNSKPWTPGPYYNWFQITAIIGKADTVSATEYKIWTLINHGWVDNNGDGVNDLPSEYGVPSKNTVKLGEWFKVKSHIYRDLTQGQYQLWINDILQWDLQNIRTIGILPERIASPPAGCSAWIANGISLYSGDLPNVHPKTLYCDDFKAWTTSSRTPCVVATSVCSSEMEPEIAHMRYVRDGMIGSNTVGRTLVDGWNTFYYSWSPPVAQFITDHNLSKPIFRILLLPLVGIIYLAAHTYALSTIINMTFASIVGFLFAATMSIMIYLVTPLKILLTVYKKIFKQHVHKNRRNLIKHARVGLPVFCDEIGMNNLTRMKDNCHWMDRMKALYEFMDKYNLDYTQYNFFSNPLEVANAFGILNEDGTDYNEVGGYGFRIWLIIH